MKRFTRQSTQRAAPSRLSHGTKVSNAGQYIFAGVYYIRDERRKARRRWKQQRDTRYDVLDDVYRGKSTRQRKSNMADTSYECVLPVLPARRRTKIDGIRRGTKRERERERSTCLRSSGWERFEVGRSTNGNDSPFGFSRERSGESSDSAWARSGFLGGQHVPLYPPWLINIVTSNIV